MIFWVWGGSAGRYICLELVCGLAADGAVALKEDIVVHLEVLLDFDAESDGSCEELFVVCGCRFEAGQCEVDVFVVAEVGELWVKQVYCLLCRACALRRCLFCGAPC